MQELTQAQTEELVELVKAAARRVAAQWPVVVEKDDLEQDIYVHLLERKGALGRIFEEDQQTRQSFLIKLGHQIASKEQQDYDRFSGNYLYDSAEVRGLLERQVWLNSEIKSSSKLDLTEGLKAMANEKSTYYAALINRFFHDIVPDAGSAEMKRTTRAVESLTEAMNRLGSRRRRDHIEGPGTRQVVSNAAAQYLTRTTESGGPN